VNLQLGWIVAAHHLCLAFLLFVFWFSFMSTCVPIPLLIWKDVAIVENGM
jgi:hypothetical protein